MALILNIDTATTYASVCLSKDDVLLDIKVNTSQKDHAAFIQPAIQQLSTATGISLEHIDAVAVSNGPGSYTGLRVGLSSAKGICYALDKPLILINTLEVMAQSAMSHIQSHPVNTTFPLLYCPMIDARRMEVFTAVYNQQSAQIVPPVAMILEATAFAELLQNHHIIFSGDGAVKFQSLQPAVNTSFISIQHDARHMQTIALNAFESARFANLAYSEPFYLKEFFSPQPKLKTD